MTLDTSTMGRNPGIYAPEVFDIMEAHSRPVWTAKDIAKISTVTRPTAARRLKEMAEDGDLETVKVGNANAYYLANVKMEAIDGDVDPIEQDLRRSFEDRFVGLPSAPWTAVHPNDGPAEAGDKVQIRVEGSPGRWRRQATHTWQNRRQELIHEETSYDETQALITGELYAKPTVPIEHENYPDDYDLELNIGGEYQEVEGRSRPILIVAGVKNHLVKPCNDAVFLKDVSVDWLSPKDQGQELGTIEITQDMIDDVDGELEEEWDELIDKSGLPVDEF